MNNIKNSVQIYIMDKEQDKISEYHMDKIERVYLYMSVLKLLLW